MAEVAARGPGRVNIVGEHTDYNGGLCLPFAIHRGVTVKAVPARGESVHVVAADLGEEDAFPLANPPPSDGWRAFARGTVAELRAVGHRIAPTRLRIEGDLPRGAGLSSSAALETALCLALLAVSGLEEPDRAGLARLCSRVENDWVGAETGLLDQLAALLGREGHALRIDFRSGALAPIPLELRGHTFATLGSGAERTHARSGYNERRAECRRACDLLGIGSLRDARPRDADRLPEPLGRRVRHVISENERVERAVEALERGDVTALGPLLDASHASLRDHYEASVPAVEAAVERARSAGALGARMVGGGFGGTVLGLFPPGARLPEGAVEVRPGPPARLLA